MIRLSDIIKISTKSEADQERSVSLKESSKEDIPKVARETESKKTRAGELYAQGLAIIEEVMSKVRWDDNIDHWLVLEFIKKLVENLLVEENEQFGCFYKQVSPKTYLGSHAVNVALLSVKIGMWLGLNKSELMDLAYAGLLHDLGMVKVELIAMRETVLGTEERKALGEHPRYSEAMLRKLGSLTEKVLLAVRTHHYKVPRDRFSQILSLADIYEAMTHERVYRRAKPPHQAITEILDKECDNFSPDIVKTLVNNIGLYPLGSPVRLSNGEGGIVIGVSKDYPLRPKVSVLFNSAGERLTQTKIVDLTAEPHLYVDGPLEEISAKVPTIQNFK